MKANMRDLPANLQNGSGTSPFMNPTVPADAVGFSPFASAAEAGMMVDPIISNQAKPDRTMPTAVDEKLQPTAAPAPKQSDWMAKCKEAWQKYPLLKLAVLVIAIYAAAKYSKLF